jgi:DNA-binding HxlR family transcriptional regulator
MAAQSPCRVDAVLKLIADRWTLGILHELSTGPRRTLDLHRCFRGLSTKTLADRLKRLLGQGLIIRTSYPESPPRVEYSLTEKGVSILPAIHLLAQTFSLFYAGSDDGSSCEACATLALADLDVPTATGGEVVVSAVDHHTVPGSARMLRAPSPPAVEAESSPHDRADEEMSPVRTTKMSTGPDSKGKKRRTDVTLL